MPTHRSNVQYCAVAVMLAGLVPGCQRAEEPAAAAVPVAPAIAEVVTRGVDDPLTPAEVARFLEIVRALPGGQVPTFSPAAAQHVDTRQPPDQLVATWRHEIQTLSAPGRQGARWRDEPALQSVFERFGIAPEEFAALTMRISLALTAESLLRRMDLSHAARRADQHAQQVSEQIVRMDAAAQNVRPLPATWEAQREQQLAALQSAVALSEFSHLLERVPPASCDAVGRFRPQLQELLPDAGATAQFERTLESQAAVGGTIRR